MDGLMMDDDVMCKTIHCCFEFELGQSELRLLNRRSTKVDLTIVFWGRPRVPAAAAVDY